MKYSELNENDIKYLLSLPNGERTINILKMRDQGKTLREIASVINRSATTVNVVIKRAERKMQWVKQKGRYPSKINPPELTTRAYNCLQNAGILDNKLTDEQMRQKIKAAIECGDLNNRCYNGMKIKNYGIKTFLELMEFAGLQYCSNPDKIKIKKQPVKTKKQSSRKKYVTVALNAETRKALIELSKKEGRNLSQTTRSIIEAKFIK
jgi:IS30 family transposase